MSEVTTTFSGDELVQEIDHAMHRLWTKAVGTKDYDKTEWKSFERQLYQLYRDRKNHEETLRCYDDRYRNV